MPAFARDTGEERFFSGCAHRDRLRLHQEGEAPRSQTFLYAVGNLMELEVIRLVDWTIELPLPGPQIRPLEHAVKSVRSLYHRVDATPPVQRVGQFVDALQIPELSVGDVAAVYGAATEGTLRPGSGMVVRFNKLVDWSQDVLGDVNQAAGWPFRRRAGLVPWRLPGRLVDDAQEVVIETIHRVSVAAVWLLEKGLLGAEKTGEVVLNIGQPAPHQHRTVFARLPVEVYRAHAAWFQRHRRTLYIGSAEALAASTHAELFHPGIGNERPQWWAHDPAAGQSTLLLVTDTRTMARAPEALRPSVIPASWALDAVMTQQQPHRALRLQNAVAPAILMNSDDAD